MMQKMSIYPVSVLSVLVLVWIPAAAGAQFTQYTAPGSFDEERESTEELLERASEEARWLLGPIAVDPWISVRDIAFVETTGEQESGVEPESDVTAAFGFGARAYVPIHRELTLALHALPEYVWWNESRERRRVNGRYGAGLFGNLGKTGVELSFTHRDDATFVSREVERQVNTRQQAAKAWLEFDLGRGVALFGGARFDRFRFLSEADDPETIDLDRLERDETVLSAGVRFELPRGFAVGLGAEHSESDFELPERSSSGLSPILQVDYDAAPLFLAVHLAWRDLEPEVGSRFVPYQDVTGSLRLAWQQAGRLTVELFGNRNLVYSTSETWAYFEESSLGTAVRLSLGSRMSFRVFVEQGTNEFAAFEAAAPRRLEDFETYGGELHVKLGRITLSLSASETVYDSNIPEQDRTTTVVRSGLNLGLRSLSPWG